VGSSSSGRAAACLLSLGRSSPSSSSSKNAVDRRAKRFATQETRKLWQQDFEGAMGANPRHVVGGGVVDGSRHGRGGRAKCQEMLDPLLHLPVCARDPVNAVQDQLEAPVAEEGGRLEFAIEYDDPAFTCAG
jgi:hypothetical protein